MNAAESSAATLSDTQTFAVFTALLPPLADVRKAHKDTSTTHDVRMGELAATTIAVGIGLWASQLVGSRMPALVALAASLLLICLYEGILTATPKENRP